MPPRIAIGGIIHETHSFADVKTTLADFAERLLYYGDSVLEHMRETRSALGGVIHAAEARDWILLPTTYGTAMPGGIVEQSAYQTILDELIQHLKSAGAVDGVLLVLHGAMITENNLDVESDILQNVRQVVGAEIPVVVVLDMHGNISPDTVRLADVLVAFDTNPHIDPFERGEEAVVIMESLLQERFRPTPFYLHPPLLLAPQATGTADLPLRPVHEEAAHMEKDGAVICIAVMAGFAYGDTPFSGPSVIVTTNNDPEKAERYAQKLVDIMLQHHQAALPELLEPDQAVTEAQSQPGAPLILVDSADNIGGGTPGDGTDALTAMLLLDAQEGTIVLADAEAVAACKAAGIGNSLTLEVGGKTDQWHGDPVEVSGSVQALSEGVFTCELPDNHFAAFYGDTVDMGNCAWLRVGGINILLTERKTPPFDLGQLRHIGIIPEQQKMIVVKSAVAYRAAYMPIAAGVIEMDTAGLCSANLARFPYEHVPRPVFPLDVLS